MKIDPSEYQKVIQLCLKKGENEWNAKLPPIAEQLTIGFCSDYTLPFPIPPADINLTKKLFECLICGSACTSHQFKHQFDQDTIDRLRVTFPTFSIITKSLEQRLFYLKDLLEKLLQALSKGESNISALVQSILHSLQPIVAFANAVDTMSIDVGEIISVAPLTDDLINVVSAVNEAIESLGSLSSSNSNDVMLVEQTRFVSNYNYALSGVTQYADYIKEITDPLRSVTESHLEDPRIDDITKNFRHQFDNLFKLTLHALDASRCEYRSYNCVVSGLLKYADRCLHQYQTVINIVHEKTNAGEHKILFNSIKIDHKILSLVIASILGAEKVSPKLSFENDAASCAKLSEKLNSRLESLPRTYKKFSHQFPSNSHTAYAPHLLFASTLGDAALRTASMALRLAFILLESDSLEGCVDVIRDVWAASAALVEQSDAAIASSKSTMTAAASIGFRNAHGLLTLAIQELQQTESDDSKLRTGAIALKLVIAALHVAPTVHTPVLAVNAVHMAARWARNFLVSEKEEFAECAKQVLIATSQLPEDRRALSTRALELVIKTDAELQKAAEKLEGGVDIIYPLLPMLVRMLSAMDAYSATVSAGNFGESVAPIIQALEVRMSVYEIFPWVMRRGLWLATYALSLSIHKLGTAALDLGLPILENLRDPISSIERAIQPFEDSWAFPDAATVNMRFALKQFILVQPKVADAMYESGDPRLVNLAAVFEGFAGQAKYFASVTPAMESKAFLANKKAGAIASYAEIYKARALMGQLASVANSDTENIDSAAVLTAALNFSEQMSKLSLYAKGIDGPNGCCRSVEGRRSGILKSIIKLIKKEGSDEAVVSEMTQLVELLKNMDEMVRKHLGEFLAQNVTLDSLEIPQTPDDAKEAPESIVLEFEETDAPTKPNNIEIVNITLVDQNVVKIPYFRLLKIAEPTEEAIKDYEEFISKRNGFDLINADTFVYYATLTEMLMASRGQLKLNEGYRRLTLGMVEKEEEVTVPPSDDEASRTVTPTSSTDELPALSSVDTVVEPSPITLPPPSGVASAKPPEKAESDKNEAKRESEFKEVPPPVKPEAPEEAKSKLEPEEKAEPEPKKEEANLPPLPPVLPNVPTAPAAPQTPQMSKTPELPKLPKKEEPPSAPELPKLPKVDEPPSVQELPKLPQKEEPPPVPSMPPVPELPKLPQVPHVLSTAEALPASSDKLPALPRLPVAPAKPPRKDAKEREEGVQALRMMGERLGKILECIDSRAIDGEKLNGLAGDLLQDQQKLEAIADKIDWSK